jgi:hypothetical protein
VIEDEDMNRILILQPHLINNLQAKFGEEVEKKRVYITPGAPRLKFVRPNGEDDSINVNLQSRYRSGVGMILYLTMHGVPAHVTASQFLDSVSSNAIMTTSHVDSFAVLQQPNIKNYVKFNGIRKFYFCTLQQWCAQARAGNVSCVADLKTAVPFKTTADYQLWEHQNAFVMSLVKTQLMEMHML